MSEIIAEKLINIESVQFSFNNHFTLTSGLKSPVYVDCRKIISFIEERNFIADSTSFTDITGWKPRYSLSEGIDLTLEFFSLQKG